MPYGMHSPWGIIQQIVKETGWTWHYVLWQVSWVNIMLMMADRPGFRRLGDEINPITGERGVIVVSKADIKKHRQQFNNGR